MNFHHAVSEKLFTCEQVVKILSKVVKGNDQAKAAVSCFSRVVDLENFDTILKMKDDQQEEVSEQSGVERNWGGGLN